MLPDKNHVQMRNSAKNNSFIVLIKVSSEIDGFSPLDTMFFAKILKFFQFFHGKLQLAVDQHGIFISYNFLLNILIETGFNYTQYPIIRNNLIRNSPEFLGKFKKRALGSSNLRNSSKNLRNSQCSNFQS